MRAWYRGNLDYAGRFGNSEALFPDDAIVWRKLNRAEKSGQPVPLSERNIEIILLWAEETISHTAMNIDEFNLVKKLLGAIGRDIEDYSHFTLR